MQINKGLAKDPLFSYLVKKSIKRFFSHYLSERSAATRSDRLKPIAFVLHKCNETYIYYIGQIDANHQTIVRRSGVESSISNVTS